MQELTFIFLALTMGLAGCTTCPRAHIRGADIRFHDGHPFSGAHW